MKLTEQFNKNVDMVIEKIRVSQQENLQAGAKIISQSIENGGIIQAFGVGHSFAGAIEIAGRAGGFIPSKAIDNFAGINGWFSNLDGVGSNFIQQVDINIADCFILISNSAQNSIHIEFAQYVKKVGCKVILITNLKEAVLKQKKGDSVLDYVDVIIDNCGYNGDCSILIDEFDIAVAPISSIAVAHIANTLTLLAIEDLQGKGITPPIFKSIHQPGGIEFNQKLITKYKNRLNRI